MQPANMTTLEHWMEMQNIDLSLIDVVRKIYMAGKTIAAKIHRAPIEGLFGGTTVTNYHGEEVKTLDLISNKEFITKLRESRYVSAMISEEDYHVIPTNSPDGKYVVAFDPLDGSSNIDANINVGSIFGIYENHTMGKLGENDYIRPGREMICAGYILYGASTMMVLSFGQSVDGFCLDRSTGDFILTHAKITMSESKGIYSVNEGNWEQWDSKITDAVEHLKSSDAEAGKKPYSLRYIGSMVADIHRTLLYGGVFMYPGMTNAPEGKLRYLYEVAPMSFLVEHAGGESYIGKSKALDYIPENIHQRVPVFMGSIGGMSIIKPYFE